jgi:hypothetical protein
MRKADTIRDVRSGGITATCPKHFCTQVCAQVPLSSQQQGLPILCAQGSPGFCSLAIVCMAPWSRCMM